MHLRTTFFYILQGVRAIFYKGISTLVSTNLGEQILSVNSTGMIEIELLFFIKKNQFKKWIVQNIIKDNFLELSIKTVLV